MALRNNPEELELVTTTIMDRIGHLRQTLHSRLTGEYLRRFDDNHRLLAEINAHVKALDDLYTYEAKETPASDEKPTIDLVASQGAQAVQAVAQQPPAVQQQIKQAS